MSSVAPTLQLFFTERMAKQRQASPRTVISYRDTFRLLLRFVQDRTGTAPSALDWDDLDATVISAFLDHLEEDRHNSARSRNTRLAALRSLFRYAALRHPEHAQLIAQVLAIPQKRFDKTIMSFLSPEEVGALLAAPDPSRWEGRRDRALMALAVQTGLRLSELIGLNCETSSSALPLTCAAPGRAARNGASRSPPRPWRCYASGYRNEVDCATSPCSQPAPVDASATMPSKHESPPTRRKPPCAAPRWGPRS